MKPELHLCSRAPVSYDTSSGAIERSTDRDKKIDVTKACKQHNFLAGSRCLCNNLRIRRCGGQHPKTYSQTCCGDVNDRGVMRPSPPAAVTACNHGSISASMNPLEPSMRSRSVRSGFGLANEARSNSPNFGTFEVLRPARLNAAS